MEEVRAGASPEAARRANVSARFLREFREKRAREEKEAQRRKAQERGGEKAKATAARKSVQRAKKSLKKHLQRKQSEAKGKAKKTEARRREMEILALKVGVTPRAEKLFPSAPNGGSGDARSSTFAWKRRAKRGCKPRIRGKLRKSGTRK